MAIICFIIFYNFIMDCLCLMPAHNHHHHRPVHMWIAMRSCPPLVVVVVTIVVVVVVVIACSYCCCCCCCCRQLSSLCICGLSQFALIASKYAVIIDLAPISILMYIVHIYLQLLVIPLICAMYQERERERNTHTRRAAERYT